MTEQVKFAADLPAEDIKRMYATWTKAFDEGAGLDMDAEVAGEAFVCFTLALMEKIIGSRELSRRLYMASLSVAARADTAECIGSTSH